MTSGHTNFNSWMAVQSKSHFQAGSLKKGPDWQKKKKKKKGRQHRNEEIDEGKSCAKQSCSSLITIQPDEPQVTPLKSSRGAPLLRLSPEKESERADSQPSSLRPPSRPHPSHVSSPHHCAVLTSGAGCRGVGRQCQVRGELPGQMQHGAVRRDAALRTDRPGRLRLLSGLCGGQRGALLPHRVGDARGEVRTGFILRVLQGRGRLRGRIRDLQRCVHMQHSDPPVVGCFCPWAAFWLSDALLHQRQHVITVF